MSIGPSLSFPQNIKLIDFGLVAKPKGGMTDQLETCCGSPAYAAPGNLHLLTYTCVAGHYWTLLFYFDPFVVL